MSKPSKMRPGFIKTAFSSISRQFNVANDILNPHRNLSAQRWFTKHHETSYFCEPLMVNIKCEPLRNLKKRCKTRKWKESWAFNRFFHVPLRRWTCHCIVSMLQHDSAKMLISNSTSVSFHSARLFQLQSCNRMEQNPMMQRKMRWDMHFFSMVSQNPLSFCYTTAGPLPPLPLEHYEATRCSHKLPKSVTIRRQKDSWQVSMVFFLTTSWVCSQFPMVNHGSTWFTMVSHHGPEKTQGNPVPLTQWSPDCPLKTAEKGKAKGRSLYSLA